MGYKLDPAVLRHLWPKAPQAKIDTICAISAETFDEFKVPDDARVVAQFMANVSHECGAGQIVRESGKYRPDRIVEVFGAPRSSARVTVKEAQFLCHDERALFERVYNLPKSPKLARELGNHEPGDGWKYRGGGDLQLTGRGSYERVGHLTGHPEIAENPDLLANHRIAFRVAVAEFVALGCIPAAKRRDTVAVRRRVNGGTNGLSEVQVWVRKWEEALPEIEAPAWAPRGSDSGEQKPFDSTVIKGTIGVTVGTAASVGSQIANSVQQTADTVTTVQNTVTATATIVHTVKPVFGLMPEAWVTIGIGAGIVALASIAFIAWDRWNRHREDTEEATA